jgi:excinuclease UvrABC helicase subunit UvrB
MVRCDWSSDVCSSDLSRKSGQDRLLKLEAEMIEAAKNLHFERAAQLRDMIAKIKG